MDLEVIGRHALFFDDDVMAAFVNSTDALVHWNSLSIDRYDVRHLLSSPPPPRSRRRNHHSTAPLIHPDDSQLDQERYLDLPPPPPLPPTHEGVYGEQPAIDGGFHAVGFSYGNAEESIDQKSDDAESCFQPPFTVPKELLQNLPPTEKLHQIIARTATFVSKNGGQSEIVLRVKQGDNPTFGFLMPDHRLHPYFRFLVDHQELVRFGGEEKSSANHAGGALSLLGTVYGSVEDEEDGAETSIIENKSENAKEGSCGPTSHKSGDTEHSAMSGGKGESFSIHALSTLKEKASLIKKNRSICSVKSGSSCGLKSNDQTTSVGSSAERNKSSAYPNSLTAKSSIIMEPPFEMKRQVDRIVEFILKNGMQLETALAEQDKDHGRFPFLQPSNQFHLYYLKALEDARQSKKPRKKTESSIHGAEKTSLREDSDSLSSVSDLPDDLNKKEKFKMVIGGMRKSGQEHPSRESREEIAVSVDAAAAAAILQAARRGIKNPNLEILPRPKPYNGGESLGIGSESTQPLGRPSPPASAMVENAAAASVMVADSAETGLNKEQKLKAERLKRAKMFAAMLRSGTVPSKAPPDSRITGLGVDVDPPREREESAKPHDSDAVETTDLRLKRSYRTRKKKHDKDDEEEEEDRDKGREESIKRELEHSRKKRHRSHRSSHHSKERHKRHGKKHSSSSKDGDSRHRRHRHEDYTDTSSDDEEYMHKRRRRSRSHRSYDDREDEDRHHHSKSRRSHKRERASEEDSEEESVREKAGDCKILDGPSQTSCRESSVDASGFSLKTSETTEVPDDLRAKIRAMLMATM